MDESIKIIGQEGYFQKVLSFILISSSVLFAVIAAAYSYLTKIPNFECCEKYDNSSYFKCPYNNGEICSYSFSYNYRKDKKNSLHNWSYTFNLYCNKEYYNALIGSSYFLGSIIGSIILTPLPDKFGRKNIYNINITINCFVMFFILICPTPSLLILLCFINGFISAIYGMFGVIISEYLSYTYRTYVMTLANAIYPFSGFILGFFFMTINNWKIFISFVSILHFITTYLCLKYFEESPRWLMSKGQYDKCIEIFNKISIINGTEKNWNEYFKKNKDKIFNLKNSINLSKKSFSMKKNIPSIFKIITFPSQRITILNLIILWFGSSSCFYGILLTLNKMKGNFFSLSILAFLGEMISELISGYLSNRYGRIFIMKYGGLIGTISFIFFEILPNNLKPLLIFISMFGFAATFNIIYIYTPEILPTSIRATICQFLFLISRTPPFIIPSLIHIIGNKIDGIFIFSGLMLSFSCFFLKETLNVGLIDEIQELNSFEGNKGNNIDDSVSFSNEEFSIFSADNYNNMEISFDMSYSRLK